MLSVMLRLLPADKRAMVQLALRMLDRLDTTEERRAVVEWGIGAFQDGKISTNEWLELGSKMGILTGPRRNGG